LLLVHGNQSNEIVKGGTRVFIEAIRHFIPTPADARPKPLQSSSIIPLVYLPLFLWFIAFSAQDIRESTALEAFLGLGALRRRVFELGGYNRSIEEEIGASIEELRKLPQGQSYSSTSGRYVDKFINTFCFQGPQNHQVYRADPGVKNFQIPYPL
jgi:hypothetical protein